MQVLFILLSWILSTLWVQLLVVDASGWMTGPTSTQRAPPLVEPCVRPAGKRILVRVTNPALSKGRPRKDGPLSWLTSST